MNREQLRKKVIEAIYSDAEAFDQEEADWVSGDVLDAILPQMTSRADLQATPDESLLTDATGRLWLMRGAFLVCFSATRPNYRVDEALSALGPLTVIWSPS